MKGKEQNIKFWNYPYNVENDEKINSYLKNVTNEIKDWIRMFQIIRSRFPDMKLYVKGGAVIGLNVLSLIPKNKQNYQNFINFFDLNLIKDWDFAIIIPTKYDNYEYEKNMSMCKQGLYSEFFRIVKKQNNIIKFNSEGAIICVVRHNNKNFVYNNNNDVLLESSISIKNSIFDKITDIEVPLTAMHYELSNANEINSFFNVVFLYTFLTIMYSLESKSVNKKYNLENKVKYIYNYVNTLSIQVPFCNRNIKTIQYIKYNKGLIDYNKNVDDYAKYAKLSLYDKQFIIIMTCDIIRLLIRYNKNYNKSLTIREFLTDFNVKKQCWYIDDYNYNINLCKNFMTYLYDKNFKEDYTTFFVILNKNIENIIEKENYDIKEINKYEYNILSILNNNSVLIDKLVHIFNKLNYLFNLLNIVRVRDFLKRNSDSEYISEFIAFINFILESFLFNKFAKYEINIYKLKNDSIAKYIVYDLFSIIDIKKI